MFTRKDKDGSAFLKVEGEMTIFNAASFRDELLECLDGYSGIELDLEDAESCDTSCVQILYSVRKTALDMKRGFNVSCVSDAVLKSVALLGLNRDDILKSYPERNIK